VEYIWFMLAEKVRRPAIIAGNKITRYPERASPPGVTNKCTVTNHVPKKGMGEGQGNSQWIMLGPSKNLIWGHKTTGKVFASFNMKKACNMHCGKGQVRTQGLGYQAERYDYCATRPVIENVGKYLNSNCWVSFLKPMSIQAIVQPMNCFFWY
jgi:hypothetical protein